MSGPLEKAVRFRAFEYPALIHEQHTVGHFAREAHFMRDAHLVEQHHGRFHRQRTGNRNTLLLTARQLPRISIGLVRQSHTLQQAHRELPRILLRHALQTHRRKHAVLQSRQMRKQVELLEHEADARAQRIHIDAVRMHVLDN